MNMNPIGLELWPPLLVATLPMVGQVHVCRKRIDRSAPCVGPDISLLDIKEQQRARRFHFLSDALTYVGTRATLRRLVGQMLALDPTAVVFRYNAFGKPSVETPSNLKFSVSHSGDFALIAFSRGREVGIDIERERRPVPDKLDTWFSVDEVEELRSLNGMDQLTAFYRCWTQKEAYLKARGEGLSFGLQRFSIRVAQKSPPALMWVDAEPTETHRWQIYDFEPHRDYRGALVVERPVDAVFYWSVDADA